MADQLDVAFSPDPILQSLWQQLTIDKTITGAEYARKTAERTAQIAQEKNLPAYGVGGGGYLIPSLNSYSSEDQQNREYYERQEQLKQELSGKSVLAPTGEKGVFSASTFDTKGNLVDVSMGKTNDPAARGTANYDPNAGGSQRFFYDASGKKLTAAQAAASATGKEFAAAGWDIGYGPGMIGPGIKADTTERDARIAATEARLNTRPASTNVSPNPTPTSPTPAVSSPVVVAAPIIPVKTAPIDTILYPSDDQLPIEIMADLIFENIGGQELINIARTDTVNGQTVIYQPIKNLTQIQQQYNPNNIVSLQATSDKYFANFSIKLDNKVPEEGNGPAGAHVYIDPETGDLVVEGINLQPDEQIELEITTSGTIYEAEL